MRIIGAIYDLGFFVDTSQFRTDTPVIIVNEVKLLNSSTLFCTTIHSAFATSVWKTRISAGVA
jgi:hypothetical protein